MTVMTKVQETYPNWQFTSSPFLMSLVATDMVAFPTLKWIELGSQLWLIMARVGLKACPMCRVVPWNQELPIGASYWWMS